MAEGPRDQASVSAADLEDDSPNMIVYRKVSLTPLVFLLKGKSWHARRPPVHRVLCVSGQLQLVSGGPGSFLKPAQLCFILPVTSSRLPGWLNDSPVRFRGKNTFLEHERSLLGILFFLFFVFFILLFL